MSLNLNELYHRAIRVEEKYTSVSRRESVHENGSFYLSCNSSYDGRTRLNISARNLKIARLISEYNIRSKFEVHVQVLSRSNESSRRSTEIINGFSLENRRSNRTGQPIVETVSQNVLQLRTR
jgi:hypothetical protein